MPAAFDADQLLRRFDKINERMRAIEAQLVILSERAGVAYNPPGEDVPPDVVELARAGETMDAIRRYRELTGAGLEEARDVVTGL